ncbi:MAG TPA: hypothetical protein VJI66_03055 [Candidatus Paceibacterota bacterium]
MNDKQNIKIALEILDDEIKGDSKSALKKMHPDYSMTWMYKTSKGTLFPRDYVRNVSDLDDVYIIKNRKYDIRNIVANVDIVMIEMIESYPDPNTGEIHKTPQVIVLEFKDGKILKGRHYCDPQISYLDIEDAEINKAFK